MLDNLAIEQLGNLSIGWVLVLCNLEYLLAIGWYIGQLEYWLDYSLVYWATEYWLVYWLGYWAFGLLDIVQFGILVGQTIVETSGIVVYWLLSTWYWFDNLP